MSNHLQREETMLCLDSTFALIESRTTREKVLQRQHLPLPEMLRAADPETQVVCEPITNL